MHRLLAVVAAGVLPWVAIACVTPIRVSSHVQPATDFTGYRSFAWQDADTLPASDRRLDRNPLFEDHMYGAVERQMAVRGIALADPAAAADLLVHYHATVTRRLETNARHEGDEVCATGTCPALNERQRAEGAAAVRDFEQCTLVVDVTDARTRQVVWRGWSEHRLDELLANPDSLARDVDRGVALMLARFPRPAASSGMRRTPGERP